MQPNDSCRSEVDPMRVTRVLTGEEDLTFTFTATVDSTVSDRSTSWVGAVLDREGVGAEGDVDRSPSSSIHADAPARDTADRATQLFLTCRAGNGKLTYTLSSNVCWIPERDRMFELVACCIEGADVPLNDLRSMCVEVSELLWAIHRAESTGPRLIFPRKRDGVTRVSEQESKMLLCQLLEKSQWFYSVETPTNETYQQQGDEAIEREKRHLRVRDPFAGLKTSQHRAEGPRKDHGRRLSKGLRKAAPRGSRRLMVPHAREHESCDVPEGLSQDSRSIRTITGRDRRAHTFNRARILCARARAAMAYDRTPHGYG